MTKFLILTSRERMEKYIDFTAIPRDWEFVYVDYGYTDDDALAAGKDAEYILVDAVCPVSRYVIENMPNLKLIHSEGVGYNRIDTAAANERGIFVCNNAGVNSAAVAEQAILLMLGLLRRLAEGDQMVRAGKQAEAKTSFILEGIHELGACHVGLIGFGSIGKATAERLSAFGTKVSCYSRSRMSDDEESRNTARYIPLGELIRECDIISIHLPVTSDTIGFVDAKFLAGMKKTAILINTARGEIVDQEALAEALAKGTIAGAGLDTMYPEPVTKNNPLLNLPEEMKYKILFSPHIAGTTHEVFKRIHQNVWNNFKAAADGKRPDNIVNDV
ncbi:MAG: NAD(P)-dependent oxidoreductase [Eubacteriales bacterium]